MPTIQVTCPACAAVLELDAEYEGQEIECGGCQEVFVAKANKPRGVTGSERGKSARGSRRRDEDDDDDDRPRRRRRDDEDDDDDDWQPRVSSQNGLAVTSLVLGLVGFGLVFATLPMVCIAGCCCAPLAWLPLPLTIPVSLGAIGTGAFGVRKPHGRGMAIAGIVLGVLAMCIAILQLVFGFLPFLAPPPPR